MTSRNSFTTGIKATHISPETGSYGSATAGEGSGEGANEGSSASPAAAAGLDRHVSPGFQDSEPGVEQTQESRSFQPRTPPRKTTANPPLDAGEGLHDITDGKSRPDHRQR